jgi:hypothetical protein
MLIYYLGRKRRGWFAPCYRSFEKAKLHRDNDGKIIGTRADDGRVYPNYLFKCKRCVICYTT